MHSLHTLSTSIHCLFACISATYCCLQLSRLNACYSIDCCLSLWVCDAGSNAKQCMMNSMRSSGLWRRSTDDPWPMQTQYHLLRCTAVSSSVDVTSGRASRLYKSRERERCGLMRAYTLGHLMRHHVVVAFSEASFKGLLAFTSTHRPL